MATFDPRQIQAKFKHASDGITGNFNKENAAKFEVALQAHINAPTTQTIAGTYRGVPVIHKFDPSTGINFILDPVDNFITLEKKRLSRFRKSVYVNKPLPH